MMCIIFINILSTVSLDIFVGTIKQIVKAGCLNVKKNESTAFNAITPVGQQYSRFIKFMNQDILGLLLNALSLSFSLSLPLSHCDSQMYLSSLYI